MIENMAEYYLKLEMLFVLTKAVCEILKEDGLKLLNPWITEEEAQIK